MNGLKKFTVLVVLLLPAVSINAEISQTPLTVTQAVDPRVMLLLSSDHQLFKKAYTDYHDLDGDGVVDTTYKDTIDYDGYFDSFKCYTYTTSGTNRFVPDSLALGANNHHCSGSLWSGNFLNWATMVRMDLVRKTLYGGKRKDDPSSTSSPTVLERAFLPKDVHSYVKTYKASSGTEMQLYTPFSVDTVSMCNVTWSTSSTQSQSLTTAPSLRIAEGFWPFWAMSEVEQCRWGGRSERPDESDDGLGNDDYTVRVEVCNSTVGLEGNCRQYPSGNYKPIGLLQDYGENEIMQFGLMTGSYQKNRSGGVLRKNITQLVGNASSADDEIASTTTGQFINQGTSDGGIINTLNRLRISKYSSSSKKYLDCSSPGILEHQLVEGNSSKGCSNWGNPLGELFLESVRYFSGANSPTSQFNANDSSYIPSLPQVSWNDPLPTTEYCASSSIIVMSTGINSFDSDTYTSAADIPGLSGAADVNANTDTVGSLEGISGAYLIGKNGVSADEQCTAKTISGLSQAVGICPDAPTMDGGFNIAGLAYHSHTQDIRSGTNYPDDQTLDTYAMSLAERIPTFEIPVGSGSVRIVPHCEANSNGSASFSTSNWRACSIVDMIVASLTVDGNGSPTAGRFFIGWEDSTWGNDYDMDGVQEIEFCVGSACSPSLPSNQVKVSTGTPYAAAGHALLFGYVMSGSTNDGTKRLVIRRGGQNFSDWTDINTFENKFNDGNSSTTPRFDYDTSTYTVTAGAAAKLLNNPLWYAAKYGGFEDDDNDGTPANTSGTDEEWDIDADGNPDNYFAIKNFNELSDALEGVLDTVVEKSTSSSSVVANSVRVQAGTSIFQARFNSADWSGQLVSFPIENDALGEAAWDSGALINQVDDAQRIIMTYHPTNRVGIPFQWNELTSGNGSQQEALKTNPDSGTVESDSVGTDRLEFLRGDRDNEEENGGTFRTRSSVLGDVVNSSPFFVGEPPFNYSDTFESVTYESFYNTYKNRTPVIYVGANDGMLHGFNGLTGEIVMSYVPQESFNNLNELTSPHYNHQFFIDGNPTVGDVFYSNAWHSVLVGSMRAGGQGLFALDVTDPAQFNESNAGSLVLWEFSDEQDADMGYTYAQAAIVKMNNNKWAAVVGNGYKNTEADGVASTTGHAVLYILFIEEGKDGTWSSNDYVKIDTEAGSLASPNGLATPAPIDTNGDGKVDVVYAGDLEGNLWKFDVSSSSTNQWKVAFKQGNTPKPLFRATESDGTVQPITVRPDVGTHPDGGFMVYFGTGKFFEIGDNDVSNYGVRTFYGVRDHNSSDFTRSSLASQSVLLTTQLFGFDLRITSDNPVDFSQKEGWYMDLPTTGEKVVSDAILRGGNIIFVTLIPSLQPCEFGGTSWLMELDAVTGARPSEAIFDLNGDNAFNVSDLANVTVDGVEQSLPPTGRKSQEGILTKPSVISAGEKEFKFSSGSSGNIEQITERPTLGTAGRKSWRQLSK